MVLMMCQLGLKNNFSSSEPFRRRNPYTQNMQFTKENGAANQNITVIE